ncbi:MAG: hypothetical protein HYZ58_09220, partial [Acidobacteria bacterium]|nr:hypothetical protein [Acidobacteriota bacterium]
MSRVRMFTVVGVLAGQALVFGQAADLGKVLAAVRDALGGEKKLAAVKTITVTGRAQRTNPSGTSTEQEFEMAIELPDKYMRRDVIMNMGNMSVYRTSGFNGDGVINEIDQPPQLAGGGNLVIRMAGPGVPGGAAATPEQQAAMRRAMLLTAKQDFARMTLGMFAQSFAVYPIAMTHAGRAESPDGKADIIEVKGEGDFTARLFVDSQSHLPLMLTWMGREPLVQTITRGGPGGGTTMVARGMPPGDAGRGAPGGGNLTPEEREKLMKEMEERAKAAEAARKVVEFRLFYTDYKEVDGVKLPHRLQRSVDGKPVEEISFERVRLNQKIDPKKFTVS